MRVEHNLDGLQQRDGRGGADGSARRGRDACKRSHRIVSLNDESIITRDLIHFALNGGSRADCEAWGATLGADRHLLAPFPCFVIISVDIMK